MGADNKLIRRILFFLFSMLAVFFLPWWLLIGLGLLGVLLFEHFLEGFFIFFLYDLLYGYEGGGYLKTQFTLTILFLLIYLLLDKTKQYIYFYNKNV